MNLPLNDSNNPNSNFPARWKMSGGSDFIADDPIKAQSQGTESGEKGFSPKLSKLPKFPKLPKLPGVPKIPFVPHFLVVGFLCLLGVLAIGGSGYFVLSTIFPRMSPLMLIPAKAEYYLAISVKKHPQIKKLESLRDKFPGGKRLFEEQTFLQRELLGAPQDPFEDIVRLANKEILLAKIPEDKPKSGTNNTGLTKLQNIVDLESNKIALQKINNFKVDQNVYAVTNQDFEKSEILTIKLRSKEGMRTSERIDFGPLPGITLPYSESVYASVIKNFIVSSENLSDVKDAISLSKSNILDSFNSGKLKSITTDKEHNQIVKHFPKEYVMKFYQKSPLEPFSNLIPTSALGQSFLDNYDTLNNIEGKNFIEVNRGLVITAKENGVSMDSYQLDWRTPNQGLKSPYKVSESLANRLPSKFSGIVPAIFAETKNIKQQKQDEEALLKEVAEKSDNRNQREAFRKAVDQLEKDKDNLRSMFNVDVDKDLFSWLDGKAAFIFNPGGKGKSPEALFVAEIKNRSSVEDSLKKFTLPDYLGASTRSYQRSVQQSSVRQIGTGLATYYVKNLAYPDSLSELVPEYLSVVPTDAVTESSFVYTVSADRQIATVQGSLPDGGSVTFSSQTGQVNATPEKEEDLRLKPTQSSHNGTNLYTIPIYEQAQFKFYMVMAATKDKAVILFSDGSQSVKDIVDFEKKATENLASRTAWKNQFGKTSGQVGGLVFIEPIKFFGTWEYIKDLFKDQLSALGTTTNDVEEVIKGYLATVKGIGTVVTKDSSVYQTKTFANIVELPQKEKNKATEALLRLIDKSNRGQSPVLGTSDSSWSERWEKIKQVFGQD